MNISAFYQGEVFDAYRHFGAHRMADGFVFRLYAPEAERVTVLGTFSDWAELEMVQDGPRGMFALRGVAADYGMMYHYAVYTKDGERLVHCDPYGQAMEKRPGLCTLLYDDGAYRFHDAAWMKVRNTAQEGPLNIYELHLGSWRQQEATPDRPEGWYSYRELAAPLIAYVQKNHYTHIELMPLAEHPYDGSWGYQVTGFFAATSRYGDPDGLKYLIDCCHQAGIGVIMDFVPVHFAVDAYGLRRFDGTELYEYPSPDVGTSEWGSCNFLHARPVVQSLLKSAANYWLTEFHVDGLRFDAVSRLIYWQGEEARGVNHDAIRFLQALNQGLKERHPSAMLIAEDSTAWPGVTRAAADGGLGFDYKWDLGFMHDTLNYFRTGPEYRSRDYHKLTFSMMYFARERYLLPFSHDEVVHGKATILQKMYGQYEDKFPQARAMYMYMMTHPGKKLNFMGGEFGQLREWDEAREQDWLLLSYPLHDAFAVYMRRLNELYRKHTCLHRDFRPDNFVWNDCHAAPLAVYAYTRQDENGALLAVFNFSADEHADYELTLPRTSSVRLLLNSAWEPFGGDVPQTRELHTCRRGKEGLLLRLELPRYCGLLFELTNV